MPAKRKMARAVSQEMPGRGVEDQRHFQPVRIRQQVELLGTGGGIDLVLVTRFLHAFKHLTRVGAVYPRSLLLTQQCTGALASRAPGLVNRGFHTLKERSGIVQASARTNLTR
ncbi:hypothetical protein [Mycolicibacterium komossense]|uniref:Uncharacterized protein n=1 Tax=Mycolicibacterium komossense TaxID=1779 RepID=A0ABT3CJW3_9MYCO|nr:hypothetical protein [Mycolicibacterium komossense]MCV7229808.1 hypothetical protein [Mycolicibacterium komossense]